MQPLPKRRAVIYASFAAILVLQAFLSMAVRDTKAAWANVPPVPSRAGASMTALGDEEMAYRLYGIMIQNFGSTGGLSIPLKDYDYKKLGQWFMLEDSLDPRSNFIPFLAAYYFSATQDPSELGPVIDYLAVAGQHPEPQKWRWLAQAVYLARFRLGDLNKAMDLANDLAALPPEGMPGWARQMPAFIAAAKGDRETAYKMTMNLLKDEGGTLQAAEVNFMVDYICNRLLDKSESAQHPLCREQK